MRGEFGAIVVGLGRGDGRVYCVVGVIESCEVLEEFCYLAGFPVELLWVV